MQRVSQSGERRRSSAAERINARLIERVLAVDGACTGEHGVGPGKKQSQRLELRDAVDLGL